MIVKEEIEKSKQRTGIEALLNLCRKSDFIISDKECIIITSTLLFIHKKEFKGDNNLFDWGYDSKKKVVLSIYEIATNPLFTNFNNSSIRDNEEIYRYSDFRYLLPLFNKLSENFYEEAIKLLIKYFESSGILTEIFYDLITKGTTRRGNFHERYFTPKLISEEVASLTNIKGATTTYDGNTIDTSIGETVVNIGAGTGGLLAEVICNNLDKDIIYRAFESNREVGLLGKMYLSLLEYKFEYQTYEIFGYDELKAWDKYDWVISDIPYDNKQELDFLKFALQVTDYKAILVVPENVLFAEKREFSEIRKTLIENDWIEAIISYPYGILKPFSNLKVSILVINKKKARREKDKVRFEIISASSKNLNIYTSSKDKGFSINRTKVTVDLQDIKKNDNYLNANRYVGEYEVSNLINDELVKLGEIATIRRGRSINTKNIKGFDSGYPFLKGKHLSNYNELPYLNESNIEYFIDNTQDLTQLISANIGDILIATIGDKLKPTLIKDRSVYFGGFLASLKINDDYIRKILPEYLVFYLRSDFIKSQHELFSANATISFISIKNIKEILIAVPTIEEQYKYIEQEISRLFKKEQKSYLEAIEKDILERANTLEHTLGNSINVISKDIEGLIRFFEQENYNPLTNKNARLEVQEKSRLSNILNRILAEVKSSNFALQNVNDWRIVSKNSLNKQRTKLKDFFEQTIESGNFSEEITIEIIAPLNLEAYIDRERFRILIRNFIRNAEKHAFVENTTNEKKVSFTISKQEDKSVQIEVQNNGRLIREDFNLNKYLNSGTNKGLKLIYNIIKAHDGTLETLSREECERLGVGSFFIIQIDKIDSDGEN